MQVRCHDGSIKTVEDSYLLQSGESIFIHAQFMDSLLDATQRQVFLDGKDGKTIVHDGTGNTACNRPGYRFIGGDVAIDDAVRATSEAMREQSYQDYKAQLQNAWRGGTPEGEPAPPTTQDEAFAARDRAYAEYIDSISHPLLRKR
jgi:hypothetical protein